MYGINNVPDTSRYSGNFIPYRQLTIDIGAQGIFSLFSGSHLGYFNDHLRCDGLGECHTAMHHGATYAAFKELWASSYNFHLETLYRMWGTRALYKHRAYVLCSVLFLFRSTGMNGHVQGIMELGLE